MTDTPTWGEYNDASNDRAIIYGAEFETSTGELESFTALHDQDADCAVCEVPRASNIMVPGTLFCLDGWTKEYAGYLMAKHYNQSDSSFICVDENSLGRNGSSHNCDGTLLYSTEATCGSLPCPPYVQDREITCVVCSK